MRYRQTDPIAGHQYPHRHRQSDNHMTLCRTVRGTYIKELSGKSKGVAEKGEVLRKVAEDALLDELMKEIEAL